MMITYLYDLIEASQFEVIFIHNLTLHNLGFSSIVLPSDN